MKTPENRTRFQASSRHYHRQRAEDENEAWDRWIADPTKRKEGGKFHVTMLWVLVAAIFLTVLGAMCYQML